MSLGQCHKDILQIFVFRSTPYSDKVEYMKGLELKVNKKDIQDDDQVVFMRTLGLKRKTKLKKCSVQFYYNKEEEVEIERDNIVNKVLLG